MHTSHESLVLSVLYSTVPVLLLYCIVLYCMLVHPSFSIFFGFSGKKVLLRFSSRAPSREKVCRREVNFKPLQGIPGKESKKLLFWNFRRHSKNPEIDVIFVTNLLLGCVLDLGRELYLFCAGQFPNRRPGIKGHRRNNCGKLHVRERHDQRAPKAVSPGQLLSSNQIPALQRVRECEHPLSHELLQRN